MKTPVLSIAAVAALGACTTAQAAPEMAAIPGVSNEETVIRSGVIEEYHIGQGDSMYVRDRENKWYRLGLNTGCLSNGFIGRTVVFDPGGMSSRIDTFTTVRFVDSERVCGIESIRRSVAPPQVDSTSPIPVD